VGDSDFFVFKDGGEHLTVRLNDEDNLDGVNDLLAGRTGPVIVFGRSGRTYLVEDRAAIEQFRAINRRMEMPDEQAAASLDQARLGAEQAELARQQADASARQARLNVLVAELGVAGRGVTGKELEKLETKREALTRQMEGISGEMDGIGKKMDGLGRRMDEIGSRMDRMGERMDEKARVAEKETRKLLKEWIRSGVAKPQP
jgi:peptidoglycan hydrolase CwlO-like protein